MSRSAAFTILPPPIARLRLVRTVHRPLYEPLPHDSARRLDDPRHVTAATSLLPPPPRDWQTKQTVRVSRSLPASERAVDLPCSR